MDTFSHTPLLTVLDSRALVVRTVSFHRLPDVETTREDVSGVGFDLAGRIIKLWDARLWARAQHDAQTQPNRTHQYNLSGVPLLSISVDEGWDLSMLRESGVVERSWEAKGASWSSEYDDILRPVSKRETAPDQVTRTMARFIYADYSEDSARHNQCGQMIKLYDSAGLSTSSEFSVLGQCLTESRQFLQETELPDWSGSPTISPDRITRSTFNVLDQLLSQTDASGNRQRFAHDVAGSTRQAWLTLKDEPETLILRGVDCNAMGQTERETLGNGLVKTWVYDSFTQRLETTRTYAHDTLAQELAYRYDPVGNVTQITDNSQTTRFFRNQEVAPTNTYRYDSLYQLVEATGRESVDSSDSYRPPDAAAPNPGDTSQLLNYRETYRYDQGGNMLELRHVRDGNTYTRSFDVASSSNRSLLKTDATPGFDTAFDVAGNLLALQPGQGLQWGLRNQLQKIVTITRANGGDDEEVYVYDGSDQRVRKRRTFLTQGTTRLEDVFYLPGLELRTCGTAVKTDEHLEVIILQAGSSNVRCLHWVNGKPEGISQNQLRYSLTDHLGSSTMEWDADARLLSHEGYLPFGETAWWAAQSALEGNYKTIRYSGKERDASGLYYYGYRYYAPWLQRWINPDPEGEIDGLNLYSMVRNNPVKYRDTDGSISEEITQGVATLRELTRDRSPERSVSPGSDTSNMISKSASNQRKNLRTLISYEVALHLDIVDRIKIQLQIVTTQLENTGSTSGKFKSAAERLSALSVTTAGAGMIGAAVGSIVAPGVGSLVGAGIGLGAGAVGRYAVVNPLLKKFNVGQPVQLQTSRLEPTRIWQAARAEATKRGWVLHNMSAFNPNTPDGMTRLMQGGAGGLGKKIIGAAGDVGGQVGAIVEVGHDLLSAFEPKMPFKLQGMIRDIDVHIDALKRSLDELKDPMSAVATVANPGITVPKYTVLDTTYSYSRLENKTKRLITKLETFKDLIRINPNSRDRSRNI